MKRQRLKVIWLPLSKQTEKVTCIIGIKYTEICFLSEKIREKTYDCLCV